MDSLFPTTSPPTRWATFLFMALFLAASAGCPSTSTGGKDGSSQVTPSKDGSAVQKDANGTKDKSDSDKDKTKDKGKTDSPPTGGLKKLRYNSPFPHDKHLSKLTNKECARCHTVEKDKTLKTLFNCKDCHIVERAISFAIEQKKAPSFYPQFPHGDHSKMKCTECHTQKKSNPALFTRQVSFNSCSECHQDHTKYSGAQSCKKCHFPNSFAIQKKRKRAFSHDDHLRGQNCAQCHQQAIQAKTLAAAVITTSGGGKLKTSTCTQCHVGDSLTTRTVKKTLPPVNFSHVDHKKNKCSDCHQAKKGNKFVLKNKLPQYEGCLECHQPWKVAKHKEVDSCLQCHQMGAPTRQMRREKRPDAHLVFTWVKDPKKASPHHQMKGDCRRCHLTDEFTGKSEKIVEKFNHGSHLPMNLKGQALGRYCLNCHSQVAQDQTLDVNLQGCNKCHAQDMKRHSSKKKEKLSVAFRHSQHGKLNCIQCHSMAPGQFAPTKIESCSSCHRPMSKVDKELGHHQKCFQCHGPRPMYEKNLATTVDKVSVVALEKGKTPHNFTGNCASCHVEKPTLHPFPQATKIVRLHRGAHIRSNCDKCHVKMQK